MSCEYLDTFKVFLRGFGFLISRVAWNLDFYFTLVYFGVVDNPDDF